MAPSVEDGTDPSAWTARSMGSKTSLRESIAATTRALAEVENEPTAVWVEGVRAALLVLYSDFRNQNEVATQTTGAYGRIVTGTPRLSYAVAQLHRERADIGVLLDRALAQVAQPAGTIQADRVRAQISTVLQQLARYQQHGSDLLHEADQVDIGGQG
jgi:hypothetical protein